MPGWSKAKRQATEEAFYAFLSRCYINSREKGRCCLGENLYDGQRRVITEIFDALEQDIHDIYILKSRQLGISTLIRALTIFLIGIHKGVKGAIVFDSTEHKDEARSENEVMIEDLPASLKFPAIKHSNRAGLTLKNESKVLFMAAGIRKVKTGGGLGRSVGLSFAHLSELCSWDNDEGLEAFRNSLSDTNPDRLYIYESTARGFNSWWTLWEEARKDTTHCKCIFLGWWSKDIQRIERGTADFAMYGETPPSDAEIEKMKSVKELYGHEVTPEQLAWIRRKMNPGARADGDADPNYEGTPMRIQEQSWTETESWQQTGSVFFAPEKLTKMTWDHVSDKYKTYSYIVSDEFAFTEVLKAPNAKMVELKVWEEPNSNDGVYVIGIDPAFGTSEHNDRSCIQVLRCYADGVDQVAEYAWPLITTQHLAWVIASLLGWYGYGQAEVRYILELNGPGAAVFNGLKQLKFQLENGYQPRDVKEKGLTDVFRNVKTYIYQRVDSMGAGFNYHFVTNTRLKIELLERLRDFVSNGMLRVRSMDLIDEMKTIARDGDQIEAPSSMRDDRVMAMAFAVRCWEEKVRRTLISQKRTREAEAARQRLSITDQVYLFQQNQLQSFFKAKNTARINDRMAMMRRNWRGR